MKILIIPPKACRSFKITQRSDHITEEDMVHELALFLANSNQPLPIEDILVGILTAPTNIVLVGVDVETSRTVLQMGRTNDDLHFNIVHNAEHLVIATEFLTPESYRVSAATLLQSRSTAAHVWRQAASIKNAQLCERQDY
jgi:hypothetical protein